MKVLRNFHSVLNTFIIDLLAGIYTMRNFYSVLNTFRIDLHNAKVQFDKSQQVLVNPTFSLN